MSKSIVLAATALVALLGSAAASAAAITADASWNGLGSVSTQGVTISACNTAAPGACSSPGYIGSRDIPGIGTGIGVQGQGNNEIDWYAVGQGGDSEMLRFQFGTASVIDTLQLGLLFDGPEYTDVQEAARFRVSYADGGTSLFTLSTLYTPAGGNASWDGGGTWYGMGLGDGQAGLWLGLNPFGTRSVLQIDMFATRGTCGTATACNDQSDYVFRSLTSTAVPEPATLALLGAGLLGIGLARRRRARA